MTSDDPDIGAHMAWYHIGQVERYLDQVPTPDWTGMSDDDRALAMVAYMAGRDGRPVTFINIPADPSAPALIGDRHDDSPHKKSKPIIDLEARRRARTLRPKRPTDHYKGK